MNEERSNWWLWLTTGALVLVIGIGVCWYFIGLPWLGGGMGLGGSGPLTFSEHVAPIIYNKCTSCHREGEAAPFSLASYDEVRAHASQIVEVTRNRFMPPWLPTGEHGQFANDRRLTDEQIKLIAKWVSLGAPAGPMSKEPPVPNFASGWQLGEPDLVVEMKETYQLAAEGRDVYRNFVMEIPEKSQRYVKAMELRPSNRRVVHHAFMEIDTSGEARRMDRESVTPGYDGMFAGDRVTSPGGHFVNWQPGKVFTPGDPEKAWTLQPGTDLVLETHLQPSGKPEEVKAKVGFYFSDQPPTKHPFKIMLRRVDIDIPAGARDHVVEDTYTLPIDLDVTAVLPHAHYLGKKIEGLATLPDGSTQSLIQIDNWDFNWQGDYQYVRPVYLPKGTVLTMRWTYDNTTGNPRNPNNPPQRVKYGVQSNDEMGELWLQVVPKAALERDLLVQDQFKKLTDEVVMRCKMTLRENPDDMATLTRISKAYILQRNYAEASPHLIFMLKLEPKNADAEHDLGFCLMKQNQLEFAEEHFKMAVQLNPRHFPSHYNLGLVHLLQNQLPDAIDEFKWCANVQPSHIDVRANLGTALARAGRFADAIPHFEAALKLTSGREDIRKNLEAARGLLGEQVSQPEVSQP